MRLFNEKELQEIEDLHLLKENFLYLLTQFKKVRAKNKRLKKFNESLWLQLQDAKQYKLFNED